MALTVKQIETYHFIRHYLLQNGVAPTEREIAEAVKIRSRGVVHRYVRALMEAGYIKLIPNKKRNIVLVPEKSLPCSKLPIIGKIAAGQPIRHTEASAEAPLLDYSHLLLRPDHFVLKVTDDSMQDSHIQTGDYLICERCTTIPHSELAVIETEGKIALKYLEYYTDKTLRLIAMHANNEPLLINKDELTIHGIYRGLIRMTDSDSINNI